MEYGLHLTSVIGDIMSEKSREDLYNNSKSAASSQLIVNKRLIPPNQ